MVHAQPHYKTPAWPMSLWALSAGALALQVGWGEQMLPNRVAVHFDATGHPNRWLERDEFLAEWVVVLVLLNVVPAVLSLFVRYVPTGWISAPNRAYWLATPERKTYLFSVLRRTLALCLFFANGTLLYAFHSIYVYATTGRFVLSGAMVIALVVAACVMGIAFPCLALRRGEAEGVGGGG